MLLVAAFFAASFLGCMWYREVQFAAASLLIATASAGAAIVFQYYRAESTEEEERCAQQPAARMRTYREDVLARDSSGVGAQASALAARGVGATGELVGKGFDAFLKEPWFWLGVGFATAAAISIFVGITGIVTAWKALHAAGAFALIAGGFFAQAYQKWAEGKEFVGNHWAAMCLTISLIGLLVTPLHKNWPMATMLVGFMLSGIAALITVLEKWPETRTFLGAWLFLKGWITVAIWVILAVALMFAYIAPTLTHGVTVTKGMASVMSFYAVGIIAFGVIIIMLWKKKS